MWRFFWLLAQLVVLHLNNINKTWSTTFRTFRGLQTHCRREHFFIFCIVWTGWPRFLISWTEPNWLVQYCFVVQNALRCSLTGACCDFQWHHAPRSALHNIICHIGKHCRIRCLIWTQTRYRILILLLCCRMYVFALYLCAPAECSKHDINNCWNFAACRTV